MCDVFMFLYFACNFPSTLSTCFCCSIMQSDYGKILNMINVACCSYLLSVWYIPIYGRMCVVTVSYCFIGNYYVFNKLQYFLVLGGTTVLPWNRGNSFSGYQYHRGHGTVMACLRFSYKNTSKKSTSQDCACAT